MGKERGMPLLVKYEIIFLEKSNTGSEGVETLCVLLRNCKDKKNLKGYIQASKQ